MTNKKLLIATNNPGKVRELQALLAEFHLDLILPADLGLNLKVEEDGLTYAENAAKKANAFAQASGLTSLADDSGLEVDALHGAPGVYSKRYAGAGKSDAERNVYLLAQMRDVPQAQRAARFRCVIVIADAQGQTWASDGVCEGEIAFESRGTNGFGYDPIFIPRGDTRHLAEFSSEEKNKISHRGRAAAGARKILERF